MDMRYKTVMVIAVLFVMQSYALNIPTSPELSELVEDDAFEAGARSTNGMLAIPDNSQQAVLDNQSNNGANDNDGDGMADDIDPDDDNDCIPDSWDANLTDFDDDGINDHEDVDDDGDGLNDSDEVSDNNSLTNIYDADNDGYHDCSSFGMLLFNMLDVEVEVASSMNGGTVSQLDALFTINASSLEIGETYAISWWLLDTNTNSIVNSSTANSFTATDTSYVMQYPWYDLENSTYYMTVELWYANGSSTNHFHLSSANTAFTVGQTGGNNNGGNSNCPPNALLSNRDFDTGNNQTEFVYGQEDIELFAYHPCLVGGVYEWNFSMSGPNGYMSNEWTDGMFFIPQGPTHYDLNMKSYANSDLSPGTYSWTYGLRNYSQGISEWFTHNFTVVSDTSNPNCGTNSNGQLFDNWNFTEISTTANFPLVITAECLKDNGQSYELVYELWEEGASGSMQDNAGSGQWDSYDETKTWPIIPSIVEGNYYVNCTVIGTHYWLEATIWSGSVNTSYFSTSWQEDDTYESISEDWFNLSAGTHCVNVTLWDITGGSQNYVDNEYQCFTLAAEPGFCTNGEITGGNGLIGQTEFIEVVVIEMTGGNYQYQYDIQDTANDLHADIVQGSSNYDFKGYYEYYDIFASNADGEFNPNGSFITIQARSDLSTSNLGVGFNIDSVGLRDGNGNVIYATEVVSAVLGDGLGVDNPAGWQDMILGPADQTPTAMGNGQASITVSFYLLR